MIQEVTCGHFPPKPCPLVEHKLLRKAEAHDIYTRPFDNALTGCPEMAGLGRSKGAGIEPTIDRLLPAGQVRIVQNVGAHGDGSRCLGIGERDADWIVARPE